MAIEVVPLGDGIFAVSWVEESGATVTNVQDYDRGVVRSSSRWRAASFSA